jgi:hypothetical protein
VYHIHQLESSSLDTLLDMPHTVQFDEFCEGDPLNSSTATAEGDQSASDGDDDTERGEGGERQEGEVRQPRSRVELIPLAVATASSSQKLRVGQGGGGEEINISDFQASDDEESGAGEVDEEVPPEKEPTSERPPEVS